MMRIALLRRDRIQRHAAGQDAATSGCAGGLKSGGRFIMANLMAFHSLLHQ